MNKSQLAILTALLTTSLGLIGIAPKSASAATIFWDLKFFDDSGDRVGTGEFDYDSATSNLVEVPDFSDSQLEIETFFVSTRLEDFTFNVQNKKYELSMFERDEDSLYQRDLWWEVNNTPATKGKTIGKGGVVYVTDGWILGDRGNGGGSPVGMSLLGSSTNATASGTWSQFDTSDTGEFLDSEGTWTATLRDDTQSNLVETTSESSNILSLLFLAGLGLATAKIKLV